MMPTREGPLLIAYDGSQPARRALHEAAELFAPRRALVVTVWEPALAFEAAMPMPAPDMAQLPVDMEEARELERDMQMRARRVCEDGAALARSAGLDAEAVAVPDEVHVADAIVGVAREREVAAIVVGSRGLSGLRARLEGSTSKGVLKHAPCPVVVVHEPDQDHG
jgi:nucleotide-binding universal stress UspA family protein